MCFFFPNAVWFVATVTVQQSERMPSRGSSQRRRTTGGGTDDSHGASPARTTAPDPLVLATPLPAGAGGAGLPLLPRAPSKKKRKDDHGKTWGGAVKKLGEANGMQRDEWLTRTAEQKETLIDAWQDKEKNITVTDAGTLRWLSKRFAAAKKKK
jgi:hypothetical protein